MKVNKKVTTCIKCLAVVEYENTDIKSGYPFGFDVREDYIICPVCKCNIYVGYRFGI